MLVRICIWSLHSRLRPVKLNMPICSVMWSQVPGVPRAWSLAFSWALISKTLSAMVFTLSFLESKAENTFWHYCDLMQGFWCSFRWDIFCWPFTKELRWVQSDGDNASSLRRWIGPSCPYNLLHLGHNSLQVVCITSHNGKVAHTLIWWHKHMTDDTVKYNI